MVPMNHPRLQRSVRRSQRWSKIVRGSRRKPPRLPRKLSQATRSCAAQRGTETAKEELQSANEELSTLNEELSTRNLHAHRINDDLENLLAAVEIPILFVGIGSRVRRFNITDGHCFSWRYRPGPAPDRIEVSRIDIAIVDKLSLT